MELLSSSSKNKKIPSKKVLIFFEEMELPCSNISVESFSYISGNGPFLYFRKWNPEKNSLYFRKRNIFIFWETDTPKKILIFQETKLPYISGNGNSKKLLIFQEVTFRARKIKRTHS